MASPEKKTKPIISFNEDSTVSSSGRPTTVKCFCGITCYGPCAPFCTFIWNSETREFLGRSLWRWGEILLYYFLFYTALLAFWSSGVAFYYSTLSSTRPRMIGADSMLTYPGLTYRPFKPNVEKGDPDVDWVTTPDFDPADDIYKTLLRMDGPYYDYRAVMDPVCNGCSPKNSWGMLPQCATNLTELEDSYDGRITGYNYKDSKGQEHTISPEDMVKKRQDDKCHTMKSCNPAPCVLLKLNRIYGYVPQHTTNVTINEFRRNVDGSEPFSMFRTFPQRVVCNTKVEVAKIQCWFNGKTSGIRYHPQQGFAIKYHKFLVNEKHGYTKVWKKNADDFHTTEKDWAFQYHDNKYATKQFEEFDYFPYEKSKKSPYVFLQFTEWDESRDMLEGSVKCEMDGLTEEQKEEGLGIVEFKVKFQMTQELKRKRDVCKSQQNWAQREKCNDVFNSFVGYEEDCCVCKKEQKGKNLGACPSKEEVKCVQQ